MALYSIANQAGAAFRAALNTVLGHLHGNRYGTTDPASVGDSTPGMFWVDSSGATPILKQRNASDTAWITIGTLADTGFELAGPLSWGRTILTSGVAATYVPPTKAKGLLVKCIGGGGGGGGAEGSLNQSASSCGGGSGSYVERFIDSPAASYSYTVGTGGAGGLATGGNGGNGGDTTFSDGASINLSAGGGIGGTGRTAITGNQVTQGATSNPASGGHINIPGEPSGAAIVLDSRVASMSNGASSILGRGGRARWNANADQGFGYGSGGGGVATENNATDRTGGAGSDGVIIIEEMYL